MPDNMLPPDAGVGEAGGQRFTASSRKLLQGPLVRLAQHARFLRQVCIIFRAISLRQLAEYVRTCAFDQL
jgi:hypothetical protein